MTGWGRRSKRRPKRNSPTSNPSPDAKSGPSEPATASTPTTITSQNDTSQIDTHAHSRIPETCQPNNILYPSQHAFQGPRSPQRANLPHPPVPEQPQPPPVYPRTLVNGVYYVHDPNSLPQPLGQGYLAWAMLEREAARQLSQRHPGESSWNNRTLRYWHLSTDFSRFREVSDEQNADDLGPNAIYRDSTPQRPYTAPSHQL